MAEEKRKPDIVIDNERFTVRVYYGERTEEERMEVIKKATAELFRRLRPQLIAQGKNEKYAKPQHTA